MVYYCYLRKSQCSLLMVSAKQGNHGYKFECLQSIMFHCLCVQVVYEIPTSHQWSFDVQWCPRNPNIISSSSFDGSVTCFSLMGGGHPLQQADKVKSSLQYVSIFASLKDKLCHFFHVFDYFALLWIRYLGVMLVIVGHITL